MGHRGAMRGDEIEAFSRRARHFNRWRSGERAELKACYNRRQRRRAKREAQAALWD